MNEIYNKSDFSSRAIGVYQARWQAAFGKEIRYATKIRDVVYGENMRFMVFFDIRIECERLVEADCQGTTRQRNVNNHDDEAHTISHQIPITFKG